MARRDYRKGALPFRFVAIPLQVLESPEYRALPAAARSLLLDVLMQFTGNNNGRLCVSFVVMQRYGWKSADTLDRAKRSLLTCPYVLITRKGRPPRTAEWIGVTWFPLDFDRSMDVDPRAWPHLNFMTLEAGSIDPNHGREKRFLQSGNRIDKNRFPGAINPESGSMNPLNGLASIRNPDRLS